MEKARLGAFPFIYPVPTILLGANVNGKPNYNVVGNCGIMCLDPPVLYVSSGKSHYTNIGIRENGSYSVNIPSVAMVQATDYCGMVSGSESDKSAIFTSFYGSLETAPMIQECPVNLECRVINTIAIGDMEVFLGEVIEGYASPDCMSDGAPSIKKIDPIIYSVQGEYWSIGEMVAKAFSVGEKYRAGEAR